MSQIREYTGTLQATGVAPQNIRANLRSNTPLLYSIQHRVVSSSSGTLTMDMADAQSFACTLTENITAFDINGPMVDGERWDIAVHLVQEATARTVAPGAGYTPLGDTFAMPTGSGDVAAFYAYTLDGGTTWFYTFASE